MEIDAEKADALGEIAASASFPICWSGRRDSNSRPSAPKTDSYIST